jgi:hypothetical protein
VSFVCLGLSLSIAALGLLAIGSPESFAAILRQVQTPAGLYLGAGGRVLLGVSLFLSAPGSRAPEILRVLAQIFLVAGVAMPFLGLEIFRSILESFLSLGPWATRAWGGVAVGFGLSIAYAVAPRSRAL